MSHLDPTRHLGDPVRELDLDASAAETRALISTRGGNYSASTLVKQDGLRVVMIAMQAGAEIPGHSVRADLTVQVLGGRVVFRVGDDERVLCAGALLALAREFEHGLRALDDSEVLLTLCWQS